MQYQSENDLIMVYVINVTEEYAFTNVECNLKIKRIYLHLQNKWLKKLRKFYKHFINT